MKKKRKVEQQVREDLWSTPSYRSNLYRIDAIKKWKYSRR